MSSIQNNIKRQLHAKNMTAAELERRTGIPHAVINILHGRSKNPSLRTAQAIAKELGCSLEDLLNDVAPKQETEQTLNMQLYTEVFKSICAQIQAANLKPTHMQMAQWLTDIYNYCLASPEKKVDSRFVQWLLER